MKLSLVKAQRLLMGIIASVESGITSPEEALAELASLKKQAPDGFEADYTLEDFQRIREDYSSSYDSSYEASTSYEG